MGTGEDGARIAALKPMPPAIFACAGGRVLLPDRRLVLVDRRDGGNLVVVPPRDVWERRELVPEELTRFSFLVAAAGSAMLDVLPQLAGGCVNYWEAGNWSLNEAAEPRGPKRARAHRRVHLHLLGRSPAASDPSWRWGEAPRFPSFAERHEWAARFERLTPGECRAVADRIEEVLVERYRCAREDVAPRPSCPSCGMPAPGGCSECRAA